MDTQTMKINLQQTAQQLSSDLIQMEKEFNAKKEQMLRVQGALEVLNQLDIEESSPEAE